MSNNLVKYNSAFMAALGVGEEQLNKELVYQSINVWDSVGHMSLIAELEDAFGITFETDDIIEFSGYEKGMEILAKYGVEL